MKAKRLHAAVLEGGIPSSPSMFVLDQRSRKGEHDAVAEEQELRREQRTDGTTWFGFD